MSADVVLNVSRAKVGPSANQQPSLTTRLGPKLETHGSRHRSERIRGQSWTQRISGDIVQNISRPKVGPNAFQQTWFKIHQGRKGELHISGTHIEGKSWTHCISAAEV